MGRRAASRFQKRQARNHSQEKPSPETGDKATAEYTPIYRFAGEFGGKSRISNLTLEWV
jgi:hypothetical protein